MASLSPEEQARLEPFLETVSLRRGETLLAVDEPIEYVWLPHDAVTSTIVDTPEGRTIEVGLMGWEGLAGLSLLLGNSRNNTTVVVQIPGNASRMRAPDFLEHVVAERGEVYDALLRYTDAFLATVAQTAACNSLHTLNERLARWILMTQDRVASDTLPLTQEFIAYMLGVRRATVSMAASAFQDRGFIHYSRGDLRVVDRPALERATCACYAIVREITERLYSVSA